MSGLQVYLVDDEAAVRRSVSFMLKTAGYAVETFESGEAFLKAAPGLAPGCVLLDIRLGGIDGLEVQQILRERGIMVPVVIITGHGDVGLAVRAMKAGAVDFIEKPFEKAQAIAAIDQALLYNDGRERLQAMAQTAQTRLNALTPRERDVLDGLVDGRANKVIAYELGLSPRTVEVYRAGLMGKMNAGSLSELVRMVLMVNWQPSA